MTDTSKAVEQHILRIDPNAQRQIGSLNAATVNLLRTLAAQLEAANARVAQARDDALVEAARIADGIVENATYNGDASVDSFNGVYQGGAIEVLEAIQALRTQPPASVEPVTVQEAARVLLELLNTPSEKAPIEARCIEDIWEATFRESGFNAVNGFLLAIAEAKP